MDGTASNPGQGNSPDAALFAHMDAAPGSPGPGAASPASPTPPADGKPSAPADGQARVDAPPKPDSSSPDGKPPEQPLSEADLLKAGLDKLGLKTKEPETADHWKKQYEASSKEGRILSAQLGALKNALLKKGLDVVRVKDQIEFKANKDFVAKETKAIAADLLKGIGDNERSMAMDNPNGFAELMVGRMLEGRVPEPTVQRGEIDDSAAAKVRTTLANAKEGNDQELPMFSDLWPFMEALSLDPSEEAQGFREFMMSSEAAYAYGLRLLHGRVYQRLSPMIARQAELKRLNEEKRQRAATDVTVTSEEARAGGGGGKPPTEAEAIATAPW